MSDERRALSVQRVWSRVRGIRPGGQALEFVGAGGLTWAAWSGIAPWAGVTLASVYLIILGNIRR